MSGLLAHKTVLLTGASKGIGAAITKALISEAAHVILNSRDIVALQSLKERLTTTHPTAKIDLLAADLSEASACVQLIQQAEALTKDGLDILINNAGVAGKISLLTEVSDADLIQTMQINLIAPALLMKHVLPRMVAKGNGHIININSVAGKTAYPYWSIYCASKFGLAALSEAVGEEQRSNGIQITSIYPGAVNTPIWDTIELNPDRSAMLSPETVAQAVMMTLTQPEGAWVSDVVMKPLHSVL